MNGRLRTSSTSTRGSGTISAPSRSPTTWWSGRRVPGSSTSAHSGLPITVPTRDGTARRTTIGTTCAALRELNSKPPSTPDRMKTRSPPHDNPHPRIRSTHDPRRRPDPLPPRVQLPRRLPPPPRLHHRRGPPPRLDLGGDRRGA